MLGIDLSRRDGRGLRILCIGAHSDDIEIGCGGTLLRLIEEVPQVEVHWVVLSASGTRREEAERSAERFLADAHARQIDIGDFADGYFPYVGADIKRHFERLKTRPDPDIVLTHFRHDLHQDHRVTSELTWNTFRNHLILEYEIPKYDGDLGAPNFFVRLSETTCARKIELLLQCFASQAGKGWFTEDSFRAMLRLRGIECNAPERYAEAFYCRKIALC